MRACAAVLGLTFVVLSGACAAGGGAGTAAAGPFGGHTVEPAALVAELAGADKPVVVCTAPPFLYRVGHVPGAILHGPASSRSGIQSLTAWATPLPRSTRIVIYCGCCPIPQCPNLDPAYDTLKTLGFTNVRVLMLRDSFRADWVEKGYPVER